MSQNTIREQKMLLALIVALNKNYTRIGGTPKEWDAVDLGTGEKLEIKSCKVENCSWVVHPRSILINKAWVFGAWRNVSKDPYVIEEELDHFLYIPSQNTYELQSYLSDRFDKHLAKNPKNDGIVITEKQIKNLFKGRDITAVYFLEMDENEFPGLEYAIV